MKYTIIYYERDLGWTYVESWDLPFNEVVERCKMIFKEGDYTHAEILEYNCKYTIENTPLEKFN